MFATDLPAPPWSYGRVDHNVIAGLAGLSAAGTIRLANPGEAGIARTTDDIVMRLGLRPEDLTPATSDFRTELFVTFDRFHGRPTVHARFHGAEPGDGADRARRIEAVLTRSGVPYSVEHDGFTVSQPSSAADGTIAAAFDRDHPLVAFGVPPGLLAAMQQGGLHMLTTLLR